MTEFKTIEFPDVDTNDFIELSSIEPHQHGFLMAEHRAKWLLCQLLEANDIKHPYDQIHFTGHHVEGVIICCKSVLEIMTQAVLKDSRESTQFGTGSAFHSSAYDTSLEANLDLKADLVSALMGFAYDHIKETEDRG